MPDPDDIQPEQEDQNHVKLIRRQPLNGEGICPRCELKADNNMRCFACDELYHVLGCTADPKGQVTRTFLQGWDTMVTKYVNIQYICDSCRHDKTLKKDVIVSNRMCLIEDDVRSIKENIADKFESLEKLVRDLSQKHDDKPVEPAQPAISYAAKAKSTRSVIVIKKKGNGPPADMNVIHQAAVDTNAAVSDAYKNNAGDTVVVCDDDQSKQSMLPILTEQMDKEKFDVVTPAHRLPTVSIIDIPHNYSKEELLERVKSHNTAKFAGIDLNEENFKVIYTRAQFKNKQLYKAKVRVSEVVRKVISNAKDHLNIGLHSCPVFDEFFVKRCNRCQKFYHYKDACRADKVVCGKCCGEHETKDCTSDTVKCYNCDQAKLTDTNHVTSHFNCPVYVEAQKKLESTINYYKDNPKN